MSVMQSKDGKDLYIDCECGCGTGIRFTIDKDATNDTYFIMSSVRCDWYSHQDRKISRIIGRKLKAISNIIRNKDYHGTEMSMTKEEFEEFQKYISNIK